MSIFSFSSFFKVDNLYFKLSSHFFSISKFAQGHTNLELHDSLLFKSSGLPISMSKRESFNFVCYINIKGIEQSFFYIWDYSFETANSNTRTVFFAKLLQARRMYVLSTCSFNDSTMKFFEFTHHLLVLDSEYVSQTHMLLFLWIRVQRFKHFLLLTAPQLKLLLNLWWLRDLTLIKLLNFTTNCIILFISPENICAQKTFWWRKQW